MKPRMSRRRARSSRVADVVEDESLGRRVAWLWVALIVAFTAAVRIRLLDVPLERDEGEFAYVGQLLLQGVAPYRLAYSMKLPGIHGAYAAMLALFGQSPAALHWGLLMLNASTIVLVYLLGARLFGRLAGVVASAAYALLSVSPSVQGFAGHATHFVVLPALGGLLLLLRAVDSRRIWIYLGSGTLVGLALIMKQQGIVFVAFAALYLFWSEWRHRDAARRVVAARGAAFVLGATLPVVLVGIAVYAAGVFDTFWFWTFSYAREYATQAGIQNGFDVVLRRTVQAIGPSAALWVLAATGLVCLWVERAKRDAATFATGLLVFSFIGVCPGLVFRGHYFILMLPAVSLLAGVAVSCARRSTTQRPHGAARRVLPILIFLALFSYVVFRQRDFLFDLDPRMVSRVTYGANPFPEALEIARYIRDHSPRTARIAVLGSEPEIFFYAERRSATGYLYTYGLMEKHSYRERMQTEMIAEIEEARPEYVVAVGVTASWTEGPNTQRLLLDWAAQYVERHYDLEGVIDIVSMNRTEYRWGEDARDYTPQSKYTLRVFRRRAP
jgi:Dolichyl-phosphate-mannose-protein mannosyltransferase